MLMIVNYNPVIGAAITFALIMFFVVLAIGVTVGGIAAAMRKSRKERKIAESRIAEYNKLYKDDYSPFE